MHRAERRTGRAWSKFHGGRSALWPLDRNGSSDDTPAELVTLMPYAGRLAALLGVACPPEAAARELLHELLSTRRTTEAVAQRLITRAEAVDLLLARLHTLIAPDRARDEAELAELAALKAEIERTWFGPKTSTELEGG